MPKVSIIIPVYNAEKYLRECIDSVLAQTFVDFELLLINDGSTDSSGEICDEYAKKDKRIKVFHKENGGVSTARNLGLDNAKGEWITFIDSDDFISDNYFNVFNQEVYNIDFFLVDIVKLNKSLKKNLTNFENDIYTLKSFLINHRVHPHFFGPTGKFYKKEIISKNKLSFDICKSFGEDTLFNLNYLKYCSNIITYNNAMYFYKNVENSLSKTPFNYNEDYILYKEVCLLLSELGNRKFVVQNTSYIFYRYLISIYKSNNSKSINTRKKLIKLLQAEKDAFSYLFSTARISKIIIWICLKFKFYSLLDFYLKKRL